MAKRTQSATQAVQGMAGSGAAVSSNVTTITVEAAPGVTATITGRSQNAGVYIHVGSQDRVVLRNLHLDSGSGNVGAASV